MKFPLVFQTLKGEEETEKCGGGEMSTATFATISHNYQYAKANKR